MSHTSENIRISVRKRLPDEIIPVTASQSHAFQEKDKENAAKYAIDLDLETTSVTSHGMDHVSAFSKSSITPFPLFPYFSVVLTVFMIAD